MHGGSEIYLTARPLALECLIEQASVDYGHQGVALDVGRKVKVLMRCPDVPLLLEFGGGFTVICESTAMQRLELPSTGAKAKGETGDERSVSKKATAVVTYCLRGDI